MEQTRGHLSEAQLDSAFHVGGLVVRVVGYAVAAYVASQYDFGHALLLGLFVGDVAASVATLFLVTGTTLVQVANDLLLLLLVAFCIGGYLHLPTDPAQRAVAGLVAFGVLASRVGAGMLTRLPLE